MTLGLSLLAGAGTGQAADVHRVLYVESNHSSEGQNSVLAYSRGNDGKLTPLTDVPFFTGGTGINNDTFGKLGPDDNDTPIALSGDGKLLFAVNAHSNTVAVFHVLDGGHLRHAKGSPFSSMGIMPNSVSVEGGVLLLSNRNEDYHQREDLLGKSKASYVSFKIEADGGLRFVSKVEVEGYQKPTQVLIAKLDPTIAFGNDF